VAGDKIAAGTANAAKPGWPCPLERESKRKAIVEAARAIAAEKGFVAVTLSAVALKMGFAPAVVYGYFATRNELLEQLSLDEESETAAPSAAAEPADEPDAPEPEPEKSAEQEPAAPEAVTETEPEMAAKPETGTPAAPAAASPENDKPPGEFKAIMKMQADELDKLAKRIIVPKSQQREGTDAVLSRLETRLHVLEQAFSELQKKQATELKDLHRQAGSATAAVLKLQTRLEDAETRNREIFAELRLGIYNLENPEAGKAKYVPPSESGEAFEPPQPQIDPAPEPEEREQNRNRFLSSARAAAMNAWAAPPPPRESFLRRMPRRKQFEIAALTLLLFIGGVAGAWRFMPPDTNSVPGRTAIVAAPQQAGTPVVKDRLTMLAEAGDAKAELILGARMMSGKDAGRNATAGARLIEDSARRGEPVAQNYAGVLYRSGIGVAPDMAKAARWFEASALQGNRSAMANLGKLYAGGWKDRTNYGEAVLWFARAANFGDTDSAFNLAVLYEMGKGVPASVFDAFKWYSIAATQGDLHASARASEIAELLRPDEITLALIIARDFKPASFNRAANEMPKQ
jgi:AcrR family transcriptional regulator